MVPDHKLILTVPPDQLQAARRFGLTLGHMAYRLGSGPHLFRAGAPVALQGGLMVADHIGFDGRGSWESLAQEILREVSARGFSGVILDFEGKPLQLLGKLVTGLGEALARRTLSLYVPEAYAPFSNQAKVIIPSALSGGSLAQRLDEAVSTYGKERVVLGVERVAEDFFLPAPSGSGRPLTREELQRRLEERAPSVFFSGELCAHYFTYMSGPSSVHFVLFDDESSIRRKLQVARRAGVGESILLYPQVDDLLPGLLGGEIT